MKYDVEKDYYQELGVATTSVEAEFMAAARRLALLGKFDRSKQEAYRILSDTVTRTQYNISRRLRESAAEKVAVNQDVCTLRLFPFLH